MQIRVNSKGQITIPADLRKKFNLHQGDEVDVVEVDGELTIIRVQQAETRGQRLVRQLRGKGQITATTDELMSELRGW